MHVSRVTYRVHAPGLVVHAMSQARGVLVEGGGGLAMYIAIQPAGRHISHHVLNGKYCLHLSLPTAGIPLLSAHCCSKSFHFMLALCYLTCVLLVLISNNVNISSFPGFYYFAFNRWYNKFAVVVKQFSQ